MKSDGELLRDYRRAGDELAFRALVERHAGLVQGVALRRTGDPELAREAAQQVFVLLAKNAGRLYAGDGLAGWLHRATVLVSGRVARRERRRGQAMRRYQDHQLLMAGTPGAEDWNDALPLVDEGLSRLPERDRIILLAHFWQGRTYQEIAATTHSTEAAVQRRASRAFTKLSALLRRHRSPVSAGVLSAGLGTLTSPASASAAAGTPSSLAAGAWIQASRQSWLTTLRWRLGEAPAFGKMRLAMGFLAGCVVLLFGGAGFAAGRFSGKKDQARRQCAGDTAAARAALQTLTADHPPPAPASGRRSLPEILEEAAAFYRDESDPAAFSRAQLVLDEIRPDEVPAALELLENQLADRAVGSRLVPSLIDRWKPVIQADEAVAWVRNHQANTELLHSCLPAAVSTWAARQPFEARDWARAHHFPLSPTDPRDLPLFGGIYANFPPDALESVWEELPALSAAESPYAEGALANLALNPETRQETRDKISALQDEKIRASLLERAGESLGRSDPEAAVAWLRDLPLTDARAALKVRGESAGQFLTDRPDLALRVFLESRRINTARPCWRNSANETCYPVPPPNDTAATLPLFSGPDDPPRVPAGRGFPGRHSWRILDRQTLRARCLCRSGGCAASPRRRLTGSNG